MYIILKRLSSFIYFILIFLLAVYALSCNYVTHRTLSNEVIKEDEDPEPDYNVTLEPKYQDFVTYIFMGNRSESFGAFFNKFYQAQDDYDAAMLDYRTTTIATYNRRLDSLNITPSISQTGKDLLNKVIERTSKIIQYNKNTRFLDDAVLLVGKSYFYMGEYLQADRKFGEFLSKLTSSPLSDEALLYLGRTRFKIGMASDGEKILNNLLASTKDLEIKSEIAQELAFNSISKNDYKTAIDNFEQSISFTKDKEKIAEKLYILAKIYSTFDAEKAYSEYLKVKAQTSDFDLTFYANLNIAKSLIELKKYGQAFELLNKLNHSYRDFPDYKQLVELEIANTLYYQKKYAEAKKQYFDIIINYAGTKSAADAYYHLGVYSENIGKNYLEAYANFKKASETNTNSDFYNYSLKRATTFDRYYSLAAIIKDTTKIILPTENKELETYKAKLEKEKGVEKQKIEEKQQQEIKGNNNPPPPKGGGEKMKYNLTDTVKNIKIDTTKRINEEPGNVLFKNKPDTTRVLKKEKTDTSKVLKQSPIDSNKTANLQDTSKLIINEDSLRAAQEKKTSDSILTVIHREDSIKIAKDYAKFGAYFQLSELFLYDINNTDSSLYYLNIVTQKCPDTNLIVKAYYSIANIYKNQNKTSEANDIFNKIISQYPNSIFANESRKILGLPVVEIEKDSADVAYKRIEDAIAGNDYQKALTGLIDFILKYPDSANKAKALYTIGWIYEYNLSNKDSSISYYKKLKDNFPASDYAMSVIPKLDFYASLEKRDSTKISNDSLKGNLDSLSLSNDSTKTSNDSIKTSNDPTKTLNDTNKFTGDTSKRNIDSLGTAPDNGEEKIPKKDGKDEKKQEQDLNKGLKPKGQYP